MKRKQRIALIWLMLSAGLSIFWGHSIERAFPAGMFDFKGPYYFARCLLLHRDPYQAGEPLRVYQEEGGDHSLLPEPLHPVLSFNMYLPTAYLLTAPFAMFSWGTARLLWISFASGAFVLAALLMWRLARDHAPGISLLLLCLVLANCEILFATGTVTGIVVSLCVVALWCFLEERFVVAGIVCLAVALAIKPHDAGWIWLFFLLSGGVYRKRALQTMALTAALGLPVILWVTQVSPHWMQELHSNLQAASSPAGNCNPGPANPHFASNPEMVIDLQSALSVFRDDPRIYNLASYLICGPLLLAWSIRTLKTRNSRTKTWLALAALVPLAMLASYHRPYDAKLLLLVAPACALLWAEGRPIRWVALLLNAAGIVLTADVPLIILELLNNHFQVSTAEISGKFITVLLLRPTPLVLLVMGCFNLWIYLRHDLTESAAQEQRESQLAPIPA